MDIIFTLQDIDKVAALLWQQQSQKKVWAFHAPMGAGKTTFIHALCEVLKVKNTVSSPTFAIINEYQSSVAGTIFHTDWYRLKNEEEAMQAGVEDILLSGNLCLIEWPEKAKGLLPDDAVNIFMEVLNESERQLRVDNLQ